MSEQRESDRQLEEELGSLTPLPVSTSFHANLKRKLGDADALVKSVRMSSRQPRYYWVIAASLAAALLASCWIFWPASTKPSKIVQQPRTVEAPPVDWTKPTLVVFRQALDDPDIGLDRILEIHSQSLLPTVPDPLTNGPRK